MILSSADILRVLGGSEVIRLSAKLKIVDGKPALSGAEGLFIYIDRFPRVDEFQATWFIYIESDGSEPDDLVLAEIQKLLPSVKVQAGLLTTVTTTDFLSGNTQRAPEAPKVQTAQVDLTQYEERFQSLVEDVQDQMLLVTSGRPGKDGQDGRDGIDGRDGKDLVATDAELFDLQDVEQGIQMERGQVLTWDGTKWTNLYVRQTMSAGGATGGSNTEPDDGLGGIVNSFWRFNDKQSESYSDGKFRVNSHQSKSDWSLTTEVYIAYEDRDGRELKNYLLNLVKPGQYLYIQRKDRQDAYALFLVEAEPVDADPKGARIGVSFVSQGSDISSITSDKTCALTFTLVSGQGGGGSTTLAGLTDTNVTGAAEGDLLVYRSGIWTSEVAPATGLQSGDNVSELVNDAGYITAGDIPADAVTSVAGKTGDVTLVKADITDFNDADFATAAQGALADTSVQPGDNVSTLTNDAGYITDPGVSQIIAGTNVTISPVGGTGAVTINASGGGGTLAELTDTNTTGASDADLLVYRSGTWTAETPASTCDYTVSDGGDFDNGTAQETGCDGIGIVGVVEMDDLSDVDLTTTAPADNDLLVYDQASGNWLPAPNTVRNLSDFDGAVLEEGATIIWDAVDEIFKQAQIGADGITSASYKFKDSLSGNPSTGHIALNNSNPTLATELRVHKTTTNGVDLTNVFAMGVGTASALYIQRKDNASEAHSYRTTGPAVDQGDYIAVPIEHNAGTGSSFTKNKVVVIGVYAKAEVSRLDAIAAPLTSTAAGTAGDVRYDADYVYICVATNTWKRSPLQTW